jgi:mono/diheme cytochrome c family protein
MHTQRTVVPCLFVVCAVLFACGPQPSGTTVPFRALDAQPAGNGSPAADPTLEQVLNGRRLVIAGGCGDCHGGWPNPASEHWLTGRTAEADASIAGEYRVWPPNLTPDPETGLGRYTDRQVFNALRYGLRPAVTPDVVITSATPGVGNHPVQPDYLSPGMPWVSMRYRSDRELWDIIAYLRQVEPVRQATPEGTRPADRWAGEYTSPDLGAYPALPFPTAAEHLGDTTRAEQILQGRHLVIALACGECHGGRSNPASPNWLRGLVPPEQQVLPSPFEIVFPIGEFKVYPRNLTPDNTTGLGRFTERQIFNSLRYGLRPGETADVEITSTAPGEGNHPVNPKYLAPPMPWPAWRHLSDDELWAIAAYLKHGVRPVRNLVADSEGPPDFWAGMYLSGEFGPYPALPFPTARERQVGVMAGRR